MKRLFLSLPLLTGVAFAASVNDLAPDFDNTIVDDFWDTTGHQYVSVAEAASDAAVFDVLETRVSSSASGSVAEFDSREKTADRSPALPIFDSTKVGLLILVR